MAPEPLKIRTLIVDDEPLARQNLWALLHNDPDIALVGTCGSALEALDLLGQKAVDLLFLDVHMPVMSGFEMLRQLPLETLPVVVFVTAYDQFALQAFEAQALDYLLKPFGDERFEAALRRAKIQVAQRFALAQSQTGTSLSEISPHLLPPALPVTQFLIKSASRVHFLKVAEIDWIEAHDYYVKLHTPTGTHLLRETMNDLESKLDPAGFFRIHRSAIVNLSRVLEVRVGAGPEYHIVLVNGTRLKMSRSRREQLATLLKKLKSP
ncbi:MAG: LytTR family DNA-binding domain-containing protein [Blastocatellia bacterium]|nr:LytTR family DNA-binding domain-containing protein [Blastocatellia bacterium]